ncbi:MAG: hypothetical protein EZS28_014099 [Streblomastix strix]|uniref:Uncharacterized protein n=1 Tax=Streblomastix strix TaxID=222440 RepID=A0A5J4W6R1_9EUKA|nr:MAG: hypothetical protein EZS28_014099 [Streblomastix strix]
MNQLQRLETAAEIVSYTFRGMVMNNNRQNFTAGGSGEYDDNQVYWGLNNIQYFINSLRQLRNNDLDQQSFSSQLELSKTCDEQIEEECGYEEVDSQLVNNGQGKYIIKDNANEAMGEILNFYIDWSNLTPE